MAARKGWYWPWILVALMGVVVVPNAILIWVATSDPSFAVELPLTDVNVNGGGGCSCRTGGSGSGGTGGGPVLVLLAGVLCAVRRRRGR